MQANSIQSVGVLFVLFVPFPVASADLEFTYGLYNTFSKGETDL